MMLKSGELGGQSSKVEGDEECLVPQYFTTSMAGLWVGSLSCCNSQLEVPFTENNLFPQGKNVFKKTALYYWVVMFLDLSPPSICEGGLVL